MTRFKIAVIGTQGKWSTEVLAAAIVQHTGHCVIVDMEQVVCDLSSGRLLYREHDLNTFDAMIVKKISTRTGVESLARFELLHLAAQAGVRIFNYSPNILNLLNRASCSLVLNRAGIPMPPTRMTEDFSQALIAVEDFNHAVFKPLYSTKARGMCLISKKKGFHRIKQEISAFQAENPMMYIQKQVALGGQDLGLVFLGNDYLGCYARVSKEGAWDTTINSGGHYARYQPNAEVIALAAKAQSLFNLDFATVDVAETEAGAVVFEVSAFGGFKGAKEGIGIDAPHLYAEYIMKILAATR